MPRWLFPLLLAAAVAPAHAKPQAYRLDPVHTHVLFFVSHLGFSKPMGRFPAVKGDFTFDPDDWSTARVDATITVDSLYLGDADWQKKVLSNDFLDAKRHPTIHFASERVEKIDDKHGRIAGQLTLLGVTRPVTLDFTLNRVGRHTYSLQYVAGFSATTTIKRSEFGMRRLLPAVGDEIEIRLEVEGIRDKDAGGDEAGTGRMRP